MEGQKTRIEKRSEYGTRAYAYKVLEKVRYNGEPVVPAIIKQYTDARGEITEVEEIEGRELRYFLADQKPSTTEKLEVLDHIVGQLQAIDKAGFVIFDRVPSMGNIMVTRWGKKGISTRQIDIEYIYTKAAGAMYTDKPNSAVVGKSDACKRLRINQWSEEVFDFAQLIKASFDDDPYIAKIVTSNEFMNKYRKMSLYGYNTDLSQNEFNTKNVLAVLRHDIQILIEEAKINQA